MSLFVPNFILALIQTHSASINVCKEKVILENDKELTESSFIGFYSQMFVYFTYKLTPLSIMLYVYSMARSFQEVFVKNVLHAY